MSKIQPIIAIVGPTASGKTALSIELAKRIDGEVVSGDSRQVYRGLDLGTGKVTRAEMEGVPHHLIDVADPREQFTVYDFVRLGRVAIQGIATRGKVPIVVGGTGLYIDALLGRRPLDAPPPNPELRARLSISDIDTLVAELKRVDPDRCARTDLKNPRRVARALEIALTTRSENTTIYSSAYSVRWIGLELPRPKLKERIVQRLQGRLVAGMLDEAKQLHANGLSYERMESLGLEYRYMARHFLGLITYDEMMTQLALEIYKYAKRQMTWFKKNQDIEWFDAREQERVLHAARD